jgi:leucyl aminopeptidase
MKYLLGGIKMDKKIKKYVEKYKKLVDLPYNQFNLDNYSEVIRETFKVQPMAYNTEANKPIKLMSGQDENACVLMTIPLEKKRKIYIVGKGILFDAGGYDLKEDMSHMKIDMAGLACAWATHAYYKKVKKTDRVVPYCPVSTNFLHNNQIIPGDRIKIGKKMVEVTNTDAEGRLILAEALSNLQPTENDIVITVATLTGCVEYAVGKKAVGVFSPNDALIQKYLSASKEAEELAWRLPLWDYLQKKYNKKIIKNSDDKISAGATEGAMFLKQFVKYPDNWIHLDIASCAFDEDKEKPTGKPLASIIKFVEGLL